MCNCPEFKNAEPYLQVNLPSARHLEFSAAPLLKQKTVTPPASARAGLKSQFSTEDYTDYIDLYVQIISVEFEKKKR